MQGLHCDAPGFTSCQYSNRLKCEAAPVPLCRSRAAAAGCEIAQSSDARPAFLCALFPIHSPVFSKLHLRRWCDKLIPGYTSAAIGGACSCDRGYVIHYTTKPIHLVLANTEAHGSTTGVLREWILRRYIWHRVSLTKQQTDKYLKINIDYSANKQVTVSRQYMD